jgi:chromosome segregation ATPase
MQEDRLISNHAHDGAALTEATSELVPSIVIPAEQLEPIRDRWMRPLVDRIAALERDAGRLEVQRDQAQVMATQAIRERDAAMHTLEIVIKERDTLLAARRRLRDRVKELEYKVRSAQDTTTLRAIHGYDLPVSRPIRHRRMAFWKRS